MRSRVKGTLQLTIKQAADILGISPNTLRAWGAAGKIPEGRHPVNNYRLYRREDVEALRRRIEKAVSMKSNTRTDAV
jgi:DNA (cytosine-5)-methyltransferase 1